MRRHFLLIANPTAGRGRDARLAQVLTHLAAAGARVERSPAGDAKTAEAAARRAGESGAYDAVIAAGGDGTIRRAAIGLAGTPTPLGVIPMGTGNVLAHELGLDLAPRALAGMLLHGATSSIKLAEANGVPFLLMAGVGFDGRVIAGLNQRAKQSIGKTAYVGPVLGALRHAGDNLTVAVDGAKMHASWALITNARHYGGGFILAPGTHVMQPGLQAILFHGKGWPRRVSQLLSVALGRMERRALRKPRDVTILPCRQAVISSAVPVPVQIDGDANAAVARLEIGLGNGKVQLICRQA